jgi:hypothetical protein
MKKAKDSNRFLREVTILIYCAPIQGKRAPNFDLVWNQQQEQTIEKKTNATEEVERAPRAVRVSIYVP